MSDVLQWWWRIVDCRIWNHVSNRFTIDRDNKRSHHMLIRAEEGGSGSTGLTQEIDLMDIGSSTPKRRKSKSPLKGVLKIRSLSDDEAPTSEPNTAQVLFSTPVSSLKAPRSTMSKLKMTRFQLPPSSEKLSYKSHISISSSARYINVRWWIFMCNANPFPLPFNVTFLTGL